MLRYDCRSGDAPEADKLRPDSVGTHKCQQRQRIFIVLTIITGILKAQIPPPSAERHLLRRLYPPYSQFRYHTYSLLHFHSHPPEADKFRQRRYGQASKENLHSPLRLVEKFTRLLVRRPTTAGWRTRFRQRRYGQASKENLHSPLRLVEKFTRLLVRRPTTAGGSARGGQVQQRRRGNLQQHQFNQESIFLRYFYTHEKDFYIVFVTIGRSTTTFISCRSATCSF